MNKEFLRFERQLGLRPKLGYNLRPHEKYRIDTDPPPPHIVDYCMSLPRNGIDDEINNEAGAPRSRWFITHPTTPTFSPGC